MNAAKSYMAKTGQVEQAWYLVDASDAVLGRLASKVATMLMGKHKPEYTPHIDTGDFVVIVNADKVRVTGSKAETKTYPYYTLYVGGYKTPSFKEMMEKKPEKVIELAVKRMLPKTKMGKAMLTKLKVYRGGEHKHHAQQPVKIEL
ncbi:MAG TPA: 50S ribosomal protein L13 [Sedimentisphaerales bacterium]|nr:50S ribosomal protein L13 [Sedimentisphaerales bacterium]